MRRLYLIGVGMGNPNGLTGDAIKAIHRCPILFGTPRLKENLVSLNKEIAVVALGDLEDRINGEENETIGVLVSGDTGFFSLAKRLEQIFKDRWLVIKIPGISSLQYFLSKTDCTYETMKIVSLHGRKKHILGPVSYSPKVFALTGGENKAHVICETLRKAGLGHVKVTAGENLSLEDERIVVGTAESLSKEIFSDLSVLLIENEQYVNKDVFFKDADFKRLKVPMTKADVRNLTIGKLGILPEDIIWDIGTGTGSLLVEMAKKAYDGMVYGVEQNETAFLLSKENAQRLGTHNVNIIHGEGSVAMKDFPTPDKVFIGGSGGQLEAMVKICVDKNPEVVVMVNAITLETLHMGVQIMEEMGLEVEVTQVVINKSQKRGNYYMMIGENPVYILRGEKNES